MGKSSNRRNLLRKIQELEIACVELNLFLDTHPDNEQALCDYNKFTEELINLKNVFEMKYGPLTNFGGSPSKFPWQLIEEPRPLAGRLIHKGGIIKCSYMKKIAIPWVKIEPREY